MGRGGAAGGIAVPCLEDSGYSTSIQPATPHLDAKRNHRTHHLVAERLRFDFENEQRSSVAPDGPGNRALGRPAFLGTTQRRKIVGSHKGRCGLVHRIQIEGFSDVPDR